jgi:hypothetical protein
MKKMQKRPLLAGLAAFIVMFVLGGVWNAVIMAGFYAANAPSNARAPQDQSFLWIGIGYLLLAAFMTFLYAQSFQNKPSAGESMQFGALFGLIATLPLYAILYAIWDISITHVIVDSLYHGVEAAIGALVLGAVMFTRKK